MRADLNAVDRTPLSSVCANRKAKALSFGLLVLISGRLTGILSAQSMPQESEQFEVASIRPDSANGGRPAIAFTPGGGIRATSVTLKLLIQIAYDIRPEQLYGGAGWTDSERYIVIATSREGGPPAAAQQEPTRKRLQALLGERFHLVLKQESNQVSGYVLTVDKKGPKLTVANDPGAPQLRQVGRWKIHGEGIEISLLARYLGVHLRSAVVDRTGLDGRYSFDLDWTPVPLPSSVASVDGLPEDSLIPAVREQLGLRLEPQKVTTDRYAIERAERPTEN